MKKASVIVLSAALSLSLAFYLLTHRGRTEAEKQSLDTKRRSKPSLATSPPTSLAQANDQPNNHDARKKDEHSDLARLSAIEIQTLTMEKFGDTRKASPRFEDYSREDQNLFLDIFALGYGKDFLSNLSNYTTPIRKATYIRDRDKFWSDFVGTWRGDFISSVIKEQDEHAYYELVVSDVGFKLSLRDSNTVYLTTDSANSRDDVTTAITSEVPKSIILTLKSRPDLGYKHNIYAHVFLSDSRDYLLGSLYNTDQWLDEENYVLADRLIFQRVQPN